MGCVQIAYSGIRTYRLVGTRIAEQWTECDVLGFLRPLGALP